MSARPHEQPIVLTRVSVYPDEQINYSYNLAFKQFLKLKVELFIGLEPYLNEQQFSGRKSKIILIQLASVLSVES